MDRSVYSGQMYSKIFFTEALNVTLHFSYFGDTLIHQTLNFLFNYFVNRLTNPCKLKNKKTNIVLRNNEANIPRGQIFKAYHINKFIICIFLKYLSSNMVPMIIQRGKKNMDLLFPCHLIFFILKISFQSPRLVFSFPDGVWAIDLNKKYHPSYLTSAQNI